MPEDDQSMWTDDLHIDKLVFPKFWPEGSPAQVRLFLQTQYDPAIHPPLHVNLVDGQYMLLGWKPENLDDIGLLEAARGYPLTEEEEAAARAWTGDDGVWPKATLHEEAMAFHAGVPKGDELPIGRRYEWTTNEELPDGYTVEWLDSTDPTGEIEGAGFLAAPVYINDEGQIVSYEPRPGLEVGRYLYLRDPEGKLVATWDEGRWWTPEESAAFRLMLKVPGLAEAGRGQFGIGRKRGKNDG